MKESAVKPTGLAKSYSFCLSPLAVSYAGGYCCFSLPGKIQQADKKGLKIYMGLKAVCESKHIAFYNHNLSGMLIVFS